MYRIAICDDELIALKLFSIKISHAFFENGLTCQIVPFSSPQKLVETMTKENNFDLLFIDIDMGHLDGIEVSQRVRDLGYQTPLVFLSNREERVFETFSVKPIYFLRKKRFESEIDQLIQLLLKHVKKDVSKTVLFNNGRQCFRLVPQDIYYLEIINQTLYIHLVDETIQLRYPMKKAQERLDEFGFIRIHKGYLVNYNYIFSIRKNDIELIDGRLVPLSRRKSKEVRDHFLRLTQNEIERG